MKVEQDGKPKSSQVSSMTSKEHKAFMRQYDTTYVAIWKDMSRKDGPKVSRLMQQSTQAKLINLKNMYFSRKGGQEVAIEKHQESKRSNYKGQKGNERDV